jgi:type III secretion protein C
MQMFLLIHTTKWEASMGKNFRPFFWLANLLLAIITMFVQSVNAVTPPFWKETGYIYSANQTPLRKLLEDFCNQFGISLNIHPSVKGTINGRIASNNAVEFLDRLALMRKFRWFVYANTLYVVPINDNLVEKIKVSSESSSEAKQAVMGIGLFESRFGWGELPDEQAIIVSGPTEYVKLIKKVLGKAEGKRNESEIMIFRLKYANADDREIQYRNKVIITPGVATILRNLLQDKRAKQPNTDLAETARNTYANLPNNAMSQGGLGNTFTSNTAAQGARPPLNPFSFLSGGNGSEASVALDQSLANSAQQNYLAGFATNGSGNNKEGRGRVPLVESDARLNAVIIRDDANKREYYQALINEFDVQPKMVEIEAMIIDVNRSKLKDLGVDWTARVGKSSFGFSPTATADLGVNGVASALGSGSSILINNLNNFYGRIRALEQDGDAYVLAKPSVITVDNLGAVLDLNHTSYIRLIGERVADVMPVTAGTMLKVTPRIINENGIQRVHMVVDIEDGSLQEAEGSATPSVERSTISTQAIIEENQALVIGGYKSQSDTRTKQRIPGLSSIPFIGGLFVRDNTNTSNKERLFVIVPRAMTKNYKRTYGNNVEGTPLPPSIPVTMAVSANGLGKIVYPNQTTTNTISTISNTNNTITPPNNPFSRNANLAPPMKPSLPPASNAVETRRTSTTTTINNKSSNIRDVSYLLNQRTASRNNNTNASIINSTPSINGMSSNLSNLARTQSTSNSLLNER